MIMQDPEHQINSRWVSTDQAAAAEAESTDREDVIFVDGFCGDETLLVRMDGVFKKELDTRVMKGQVAQTCLITIFIDY